MAIRVTCPDCRRELSPVPDHLAGEVVVCDFCGAEAVVPARTRRAAEDDPAYGPAPKPRGIPVGVLVGGLVFAALGGLVVLVWAALPPGGNGAPGNGPAAVAPPPLPHEDPLADLRSDDAVRRAAGVKYFAETAPTRAGAEEVRAALAAFPIDDHPDLTDPYLDALTKWEAKNAALAERLARDPGLPPDRAVRLALLQVRHRETRAAAELLAPLVFRADPRPGAEEVFKGCHPHAELVTERWLFDPDPAARAKAEAVFRAQRQSKYDKGAPDRIILELALKTIPDADRARGRAAVDRVKEIVVGGTGDWNLVHFIEILVRLTEQQPDNPNVAEFGAVVAGVVTARNARAAVIKLGKTPLPHPAVAGVFAAAARFPTAELVEFYVAWLGHPAGGAAAAQAIKALGPAAVEPLRFAMRSAAGDQRREVRRLLVALNGPAPPGGPDPYVQFLTQTVGERPSKPETVAEALDDLAAIDPSTAAEADRDAVMAALDRIVGQPHPALDARFVRAMTRWAADRHYKRVAYAVYMKHGQDVSGLLPLLGRSKDASFDTVSAITKAALTPANREAAVAAVVALGPGTEKWVLGAPDTWDHLPADVQVVYCRMIEAIGSPVAYPKLAHLRKTRAGRPGFGEVVEAAEKAEKAVRERAAK